MEPQACIASTLNSSESGNSSNVAGRSTNVLHQLHRTQLTGHGLSTTRLAPALRRHLIQRYAGLPLTLHALEEQLLRVRDISCGTPAFLPTLVADARAAKDDGCINNDNSTSVTGVDEHVNNSNYTVCNTKDSYAVHRLLHFQRACKPPLRRLCARLCDPLSFSFSTVMGGLGVQRQADVEGTEGAEGLPGTMPPGGAEEEGEGGAVPPFHHNLWEDNSPGLLVSCLLCCVMRVASVLVHFS